MSDLFLMKKRLVEMMNVFHCFCVEHSLRYYAAAGTALGAARHKGFIPWDDDIDIEMPRPDYECLIELFNKENKDKHFILEGYNSADPLFLFPYSKLYDSDTTLIESTKNPLKRGIYLDIFPIDGAGFLENDAKKLIRRINRLFFLINMHKIKISKERSILKNLVLVLFQAIPNCFFNDKNSCLEIDRLSKTFNYESSKYVTCFVFGNGKRGLVPKSVFGTPTLMPFEDISIYCPEDIDTYLTGLFGDWRTPPPKEKQITHHSYYLDLTKSYLE